jgi:hypothetical protein
VPINPVAKALSLTYRANALRDAAIKGWSVWFARWE